MQSCYLHYEYYFLINRLSPVISTSSPHQASRIILGKNPYREGATSHLDILERTETITPITFQIPGDTNQQFMGLLSSLMGKYPSHRPRNAIQALDWLSSVKQTLQFEET